MGINNIPTELAQWIKSKPLFFCCQFLHFQLFLIFSCCLQGNKFDFVKGSGTSKGFISLFVLYPIDLTFAGSTCSWKFSGNLRSHHSGEELFNQVFTSAKHLHIPAIMEKKNFGRTQELPNHPAQVMLQFPDPSAEFTGRAVKKGGGKKATQK